MSKIFGIGLNKTGTNSLNEALKILGFRAIHYPNDEITYSELSMGCFKLSIMNHYDAATDLSIAGYYAELDREFPDSKFILTVRNKQEWLRSVHNHWIHNQYLYESNSESNHRHKFGKFITLAVFGCYQFNAERFSRVYDLHCKNVIDYFGNNVLVYNICGREGWEPLCKFLNMDVPNSSFPYLNKGVYHEEVACVFGDEQQSRSPASISMA
jgi:hypothetical protein